MPDFPPPTPQPQPNFPEEIGGYRIQRVLGSGGMATVYAALQKQPRRIVAIKVIKPGVSAASPDSALRRFKREIEILGKLHHPYIAQVYDAGVHDEGAGAGEVPYFVMEYISGARTILEHVAAKQLDTRERLKLFAKICAAVEHGHQNKIIHRDLKPGNILIDQYGEPKIIDFGIAHATDLEVSSQTMHTEAGDLVGTLQYMAPEQVDTKLTDLDARCDVYALGVLLHKLLTGKLPHELEGLPVYEAVRMVREETPPPPSSIKPELKGDLETIILKAIEHDRTRRYKNAGSLGRDVVRYLGHKPIHARRASLIHRARLFAKRHRAAMNAGLVAAGVMAIALGIVLYDRQGHRGSPLSSSPPAAPRAPDPLQPTPPVIAPPQRESFTIAHHTGRVSALAWLEQGNKLAAASFDHTMTMWDVPSRTLVWTLTEHTAAIECMASSADGRFIASSTRAGPVIIVETQSGNVAHRIYSPSAVRSLALSADGALLAIGGEDMTLRLLALPADSQSLPHILHVLRSATGAFTCTAFDESSQFLTAVSQRGNLSIWHVDDAITLRQAPDLRGEGVAIMITSQQVLAVDVTGRYLRVPVESMAGADQKLQHADLISISPQPENVLAASFTGDGNFLALATSRSTMLCDVRRQPPAVIERKFLDQGAPYSVAIGSDDTGAWLATGHDGGDIKFVPMQLP